MAGRRTKNKLAVLIRDGFLCQRCGRRLYLRKSHKQPGDVKAHIHHIIHKEDGGDDSVDNMISTCWPCECRAHKHIGCYYWPATNQE